MATQLLATGNTAANSADLVVAAGTSVTVALKGAEAGALVRILLKDDAGVYNSTGQRGVLTDGNPVTVISAPGTYRLQRAAGAACGVFSA